MRIYQRIMTCSRWCLPVLAMAIGLALSCNSSPTEIHRVQQAEAVCCADCDICGNGVLEYGEACDDGNNEAGDGCSPACAIESCGNGELDPGEQCDDGNLVPGDGCNSQCQIEECGDGIVEGDEQCDDGNLDFGDGCTPWCTLEGCGDGNLDLASEECDDGNRDPGDGCDSQCRIETEHVGSCGDGVVDPGEQCDDGNDDDGDGCVGCVAQVECSAATACGGG